MREKEEDKILKRFNEWDAANEHKRTNTNLKKWSEKVKKVRAAKTKMKKLTIDNNVHLTMSWLSEHTNKPRIEIQMKQYYLTKTQAQKLMRDLYKHVQNCERWETAKRDALQTKSK